MPFIQSDLDKLEAAISDGRGARSVTFADQSVTFNSIEDMLKLRTTMKREIDVATVRRFRVAATSKGVS